MSRPIALGVSEEQVQQANSYNRKLLHELLQEHIREVQGAPISAWLGQNCHVLMPLKKELALYFYTLSLKIPERGTTLRTFCSAHDVKKAIRLVVDDNMAELIRHLEERSWPSDYARHHWTRI